MKYLFLILLLFSCTSQQERQYYKTIEISIYCKNATIATGWTSTAYLHNMGECSNKLSEYVRFYSDNFRVSRDQIDILFEKSQCEFSALCKIESSTGETIDKFYIE